MIVHLSNTYFVLSVVEVAPGVQAVWASTEAPRMSRFAIPKMANAYILDGDILVEPCVQDHQRMTDWYGLFASWPLRFRAVFLTHRHLDHSKGVDLIAQRLGTPVIGPGHTGEAHGWTILQTPGHAPDHICFWNGVTLIAGDMLYDTEPALVPAEGGDLEAYRGSTAMLRSLRPKLLLPGHGRPNFNPDAALARAEELVLNAQ